MCMWVWAGICDRRYPQRSEVLDSLEVELQATVSHSTVPDTKLWFSAGAGCALGCGAISVAPL